MKLARFRSGEAQRDFLHKYDRAAADLWPVPAVEEDIETGFGTTHVRRSGPVEDRPPLVLLPPHTATSVSWYRLVEPLSARREVIAVDTIGAIGRSVQTRPISGPADFAAWMSELVDRLGRGRVHLAGFSEGGYVAMCCALGAADRLQSLMALEPGGAISRVRPRFLGAMIWAGIRAQFDKDVLRQFADRLQPGVELLDVEWEMALSGMFGFRQALPAPRRFSNDQLRSMAEVPLLLYMAADTELYDPNVAAARARELLPNAETVIVQSARHGLPYQFPERTVVDMLAFMKRHDGPAPR